MGSSRKRNALKRGAFTHKGGMPQNTQGKMHSKSTNIMSGSATNKKVAGRAPTKGATGARKAKNGYNRRGAGKTSNPY